MLTISAIGHLGSDAEVKNISGKNYFSFSIAHTEKKAGVDKTTWVRCLKQVRENDRLGEWLKKGTQVYVSGTPYTNGYAKDNDPKNIIADLNVFVNQLELLGGRREPDPMANVNPNDFSQPTQEQKEQAFFREKEMQSGRGSGLPDIGDDVDDQPF